MSSSSKNHHGTDIEEILIVMENNSYFEKIPDLKLRFWDMFIIDALINNNDRNNNNWGLILNRDTMELRVSPVYDNGAAFYSKSSSEKISKVLEDEFKMKQVIYDSCVSAFVLNGKIINPLKYKCNKALIRILPKINLVKIK